MTQPEVHRPRLEELEIGPGELATAMGYPGGEAPPYLEPILERVLDSAVDHVNLVCGWHVYEPDDVQVGIEGFELKHLDFATGRIIAGGLRKADALAVFVATAGPGIEQWRRAAMEEDDDPIQAYTIDAFGSEAADRCADWLDRKIERGVAERGWGVTDRFSPGYCEWSVAEQHKLFSLFPADFCGISLTESALMRPIKSVSGVMGLGPQARRRGYACNICTMTNCFRRNARKV